MALRDQEEAFDCGDFGSGVLAIIDDMALVFADGAAVDVALRGAGSEAIVQLVAALRYEDTLSVSLLPFDT